MKKIKVTGSLIELSEADQLLTYVSLKDKKRIEAEYQKIKEAKGDVIDVDQDYEDVVKALEDYYAED